MTGFARADFSVEMSRLAGRHLGVFQVGELASSANAAGENLNADILRRQLAQLDPSFDADALACGIAGGGGVGGRIDLDLAPLAGDAVAPG